MLHNDKYINKYNSIIKGKKNSEDDKLANINIVSNTKNAIANNYGYYKTSRIIIALRATFYNNSVFLSAVI